MQGGLSAELARQRLEELLHDAEMQRAALSRASNGRARRRFGRGGRIALRRTPTERVARTSAEEA